MKWASDVLAERVGFEPTVPCEDNGFRDLNNSKIPDVEKPDKT